MAKISEIDESALQQWLSTRPPVIQALAQRVPPGRLYLLKTTNHRVTIHAYSEDGTVTVAVTGEYNLTRFDRQVFGINPDDLEECDLPPPGEPLGTILTDPKDVADYIATMRP